MPIKYSPRAVQDSELFGRVLRWIERRVHCEWRSIRVSVSTIRWGSDVGGPKSRIQWRAEQLLHSVQILASAKINEKDGDSD
jgi:hypothetical protein